MSWPKVLRRIAIIVVAAPAAVATLGYAASYLLPACKPQMYGVGECFVGSVNLAPAILVAVGMGLYLAAGALVFVATPLLALAWWLGYRRRRCAT